MTKNAPLKCAWLDAVTQSLNSVVGEEESLSIAEHLDECDTCRQVAEIGGDPLIKDALLDLSASRKSLPHDLSVPVTKLNRILLDYEIIKEIGRGGMGVVFKARQIELDRDVALKVLPGIESAVRAESVSRFRREAAFAAKLKHSNIVAIHDCGQVDGTFYYAMELIEGQTIADAVHCLKGRARESHKSIGVRNTADAPTCTSRGTSADTLIEGAHLPGSSPARPLLSRAYFRRVAEKISDMAEALHYAHLNGVIHRDIKPSNLLIAPDGRFMIADFGLAFHSDFGTAGTHREISGTFRYMSPECIDRTQGVIDHRADIYAVGATIYELLTLRPMVDADSEHQPILDLLSQEPATPRSISSRVPRELEFICMKAAAKSPEERYQSAKELADDLHRWLFDLPISAKRAPLTSRAVKFVRRHKAGTISLLTILIAATTSVVVSAIAYRTQADAQQLIRNTREQRVERAMFDALGCMSTDRIPAGMHILSNLVKLNPDKISPQLVYARMLDRFGAPDQARDIAEDLVARYPDHVAVRRLISCLGSGDYKRSFDSSTSNSDTMPLVKAATESALDQALVEPQADAAIRILDAAIDDAPDTMSCVMLRCLLLLNTGEYDRVLRDASLVTRVHYDWSFGYGIKAMAHNSLGQWQDAKRNFDLAVDLDPDQAQWLVGRSRAKQVFGQWESAVKDASRAIAIDPTINTAYLARATALIRGRDYNSAIRDLDSLITRDPNQGSYYYLRSQAHRKAGRFEQELADLKTAAQVAPERVEVIIRTGESYLSFNNFDQAISAYTHAMELQPENPYIRLRRAIAYDLSGAKRQALGDLDQLCMSESPIVALAQFNRFLILRESNAPDTTDTIAGTIALTDDTWTMCIRDYLLENITVEALFACAKSRLQSCEAQFYVGRLALVYGKTALAASAFQNCMALNPGGVIESEFAELYFKQLSEHNTRQD